MSLQNSSREARQRARGRWPHCPRGRTPGFCHVHATLTIWVTLRKSLRSFLNSCVYSCLQSPGYSTDIYCIEHLLCAQHLGVQRAQEERHRQRQPPTQGSCRLAGKLDTEPKAEGILTLREKLRQQEELTLGHSDMGRGVVWEGF